MDRVTGALRIVGNPGGLFHLRDGAVIAVDSPGSPGAGRTGEKEWTAALVDGAFATAAGEIERCFVDDSVDQSLLLASDGVAPDWLLSETASRLDAVASLPFPLSPYLDRVVGACPEPAVLTVEQREIIATATGRRNARDIAFALGRYLYPVTAEISRMLGDGLLEIAPPETAFGFSHWGLTSLRPRAAPGQNPRRGADQASSLPTRRPGQAASAFRNRLRPAEV